MKKIVLLFYGVCNLIISSYAQQSNPSCPNGDLESGNITQWQQLLGTSGNPLSLNSFGFGTDFNRAGTQCGGTGVCANFQAVPPGGGGIPKQLNNGVDYYGGFTVPNQGTYCVRVGNNAGGTQADMMKYTFVVTPQNKTFKFRYAVVLEDGGHSAGEQPAIGYYFVKGNKIVPFGGFGNFWDQYLFNHTANSISANPNNPFFKKSTVNSTVIYKDWQCVELDLSYMMGQQVTFCFWSKDCTQGGHFGYAYLDGLCTDWPAIANFTLNKTDFCDNGQSLIMDGSSSTNEDRYFIEVLETNSSGNAIQNGFVFSQWFYTQTPSNINITQWLQTNNKKLKCNSFYKIKLAVMNDCAQWNEKNMIVHFTCPNIDAGPNKTLCCGEGIATDNCVPLGTSTNSNLTYNWTSYPTGFSSNQAQTNDCPLNSTAYILTVTDNNGCKASDSVIVKYKGSTPTLDIKNSAGDYSCIPCGLDKNFYALIQGNDCQKEDKYFTDNYPGQNAGNSLTWLFFNLSTYTFSNIQSGSNYTAPNQTGIVYAVYNNGCKQLVASVPITKYNTQFPSIIAPNAFSPINQDGLNDYLEFIDYGLNVPLYGQGPAYGSTDFELTIFDRWGGEIKTISKSTLGIPDAQCLKNGDIKWDGRDGGGQIVPQGVYNYRLRLRLCNGNWWDVPFPGSTYNPCVSWIWIFCTQHLQGFINHVTVI